MNRTDPPPGEAESQPSGRTGTEEIPLETTETEKSSPRASSATETPKNSPPLEASSTKIESPRSKGKDSKKEKELREKEKREAKEKEKEAKEREREAKEKEKEKEREAKAKEKEAKEKEKREKEEKEKKEREEKKEKDKSKEKDKDDKKEKTTKDETAVKGDQGPGEKGERGDSGSRTHRSEVGETSHSAGVLLKTLKGFRRRVSKVTESLGGHLVSARAVSSSPVNKYRNSVSGRHSPQVRRLGFEDKPLPRVINCRSEKNFEAESVRFFLLAIQDVLSERPFGKVVVGLSGGKTPKPIFEAVRRFRHHCGDESTCIASVVSEHGGEGSVATSSGGGRIDWSRVVFFLVDERYIPADSPDCNQKMVREALLEGEDGLPVPEENLYFPDTSLPLEECVVEYRERLTALFTTVDMPHLVLLGMGDDGHTASWFPPLSPAQYMEASSGKLVSQTTTDRFTVRDRITVSLGVICSARYKLFLLQGESKKLKWKELLQMKDTSAIVQQPILKVLSSGGVTAVSFPPIDDDEEVVALEGDHLSIIVFGASGDLAKKKTYPALFSLYCEGHLPNNFHVVGFARSSLKMDEFWARLEPNLTKLATFFHSRGVNSSGYLESFVDRFKAHCLYFSGAYDKAESFGDLDTVLCDFEKGAKRGNRLFYLALPPNVFTTAVGHARAGAWSSSGWNRVIVEKPFGRDLESSNKMSQDIMEHLREEETFRIDHYLGKEMVLNMISLRFANAAFNPLWSRQHVSSIRITFKEDIGTEGRGGYFDNFGIIRDVMQNHLLQMLTLVAMDRPATLKDDDIRDEKVKVLKQMAPIKFENCVVGQYGPSEDGKEPSYLEDPTVPSGSRCPTFAVCVAFVNSERWHGVPFILKAGKALEERLTEIRMQFRSMSGGIYPGELPQNELVVKVQPHEAIYMKVLAKRPGLTNKGLEQTELDLSVMDRFDVDRLPDAYERLILDVIKGDKQNFVRTDELREAWRVFTPLLKDIDGAKKSPLKYPFGSRGPEEAYDLIRKFGYNRHAGYTWNKM